MITRRKARELAFQAIFSWFLTNQNPEEIFNIQLSEPYHSLLRANKPIDLSTAAFLKRLFYGVINHWEEIQLLLKQFIIGWELDRLMNTDRVLMSMAIYEFLYEDEIPFPVTIDEYTTLSHRYSSLESPSFVNSILDQIRLFIEKQPKGIK